MRVLFAITKGEVGGAQQYVRLLAQGQLARGHDVGVVTEPDEQLAVALAREGAQVFPWPSIVRDPHPRRDLRARAELRRLIKAFQPDVLHLNSSKAGIIGRGILRPPQGVTLYTCHHAAFGTGRRWQHRAIARPVEQLTLRFVDGVISVGFRDLPLLQKMAPLVPMTLIRNAVPSSGEPLSPEQPVPTALWVARMASPKDPMRAVAAWERVVRSVPEARLVMAGTGPLLESVRRRAAAGSCRDSIEIVGFAPDLDALYARASVFLLMSNAEGGLTIATLEAMSHGLVPVVSDVGDAFLLAHHECGVVAARRSTRAHSAAVVSLLRHPARTAGMRRRAIRYARKGWTVDDMVARTLDFYALVLARRGTRRRAS